LRALLTNLLNPGEAPADINRLSIPWGISRHQLDRLTGIESSLATDEETELLMAKALVALSEDPSSPCFLKTHCGNYPLLGGEHRFPIPAIRCVIHLVRHPGAICRSYANHLGCSLETVVNILSDPGHVVGRVDLLAVPPEPVGSWSQHVSSWLGWPEGKSLLVRYEDLREHTEDYLAAICDHCSISYNAQSLKKAIEFSSLEELRRQEKAKGFRERPPSCAQFFGSGRIDGFGDDFPPALRETVLAHHSAVMARLGYLEGKA